MSGTKDGKELGHEAEEENLQRLREAERLEEEDKPNTSSPSSSSSGPVPEPAAARSTKSKPKKAEKSHQNQQNYGIDQIWANHSNRQIGQPLTLARH